MKRNAREVQSPRSGTSGSRIEHEKHPNAGWKAGTRHQVPRALQGILQSLTLDNAVSAATLRHQCEGGTVPVRVLIKLLDCGYLKPPKGVPTKASRMPFIGTDGRAWDWKERLREAAAQDPQTTLIQSFTLGNPVVRTRLQRELEDGTMHPTVCNWFIEHGWELLLKQTEQKFRMPYIGRHGLPWFYDVMADQEKEAIEAQKAQNKTEARAQQAPEVEKEPAAGEQEAVELEELEVYREKGDRGYRA
jgi:hypothetical protein